MKVTRYKKILGISVGERSLYVAELSAASVPTEKPELRQVAELSFPEKVSLDTPAELGAALASLLRDRKISASAAIFGLPARWIVAATKELPDSAVDATTRADILRLTAESEFSVELRDLVFDFVDDGSIGSDSTTTMRESNVLLMATPRKHVDALVAVAKAAKLKAIAVLPSAVALGEVASRSKGDALVLSVGINSAELTSQSRGGVRALRHMRAGAPASMATTTDKAAPVAGAGVVGVSVSELRRVVSTLPSASMARSSNGTLNGNGATHLKRDLIVWNAPSLDSQLLAEQTGLTVRTGDIAVLGVRPANQAIDVQRFAAAIALGVVAIANPTGGDVILRPTIDFLHSRLAPVVTHRVPRWIILTALTTIVVVAGGAKLYSDLNRDQAILERDQARMDERKPQLAIAAKFVNNVSFAQSFHGGDPRFLACVRDLTLAIPDDGQTIATSVTLKEVPKPPGNPSSSSTSTALKKVETPPLQGELFGKTTDQQHVQWVLDNMRKIPGFASAKLNNTQDAGKGREVAFSIKFDYQPTKQ